MDKAMLNTMLAPLVAPLGLEIDRIDLLTAGHRRLVRVRLDGDGPRGSGPDLNQIATATKVISAALDEADTGSQPYVLEVSSRGVDAPLRTVAQFRRNCGRLVAVSRRDGTTMTGRITACDDRAVMLTGETGDEQTVPLGDIAQAVVQVEFNRPGADESGNSGSSDDEEE